MSGEVDRFHIGMRVLVVDNNPTCLMVLCRLLRECQYQVTTATQARAALRMLRENRNRFDLMIISDVQMPDMDGFKLLELVGLETDLPVIVSGNCDPKLVMKGITHGACDYLVKPVRLEELRNIWQHVIRKKKVDPESQTSRDNSNQGSEGGGQDPADQNVKVNRKRKDEEEKGDDNENENDDPSSQKKPRVVWSMELHRKFVAAVNQLGIDKAVPKRILDMMNVEGLTRENVASHLQKYRLYLKRISMQQANMVATFGGKDGSYIRVGPIDDYRTSAPSFSSKRKRSWCNLWIGLVLMIFLLLFVCSILLNKQESLSGCTSKKLQIKREIDYFRQVCKNLSNHPTCQRISRSFLQ